MTIVTRMLAAMACTVALMAGPDVHAAQTLFAIGSDANGIGRVLAPILPAGAGTALGDGSVAFNGGLAWSSGTWWAIENDSLGRSTLVSFAESAPNTVLSSTALGTGFFGGLAFGQGGSLFAIGADASGASALYRVGSASGATLVGSLGPGVMDLGFDAADGQLYALAGDASGVPRLLERLTLGGSSGVSTTSLFALGDGSTGFLGGLAWDGAAGRFLTVGSDSAGQSTLYGFDLSGAGSLTALQALGPGYLHGGLAFASPVPEPAAAWLLLAGGIALLAVRKRHPTSDGA